MDKTCSMNKYTDEDTETRETTEYERDDPRKTKPTPSSKRETIAYCCFLPAVPAGPFSLSKDAYETCRLFKAERPT